MGWNFISIIKWSIWMGYLWHTHIKDCVKAIKLSFLDLSEKDQMSSLLLSRQKEGKMKLLLWSMELRFDGQVEENLEARRKSMV